MKKIKVNEIFFSLQGEGANQGMPAIFIRLAECNLKCSFCDTSFNSYTLMSVSEIMEKISSYTCKNIIWTGGEPTLQLDDEIISYFEGYWHAIETNGTKAVPSKINYITCSPKVPSSILHKHLEFANEFRFATMAGDSIPNIESLPRFDHLFLSPIFNQDNSINQDNLNYCINYIQKNPGWRLSIQIHKLIGIE